MSQEEAMDTGEMFQAMRKQSQHRRNRNQQTSAEILQKYPGLRIETRNHGVHLIVRKGEKTVDFWPSTGKWIDREYPGVHMRGVFSLLKRLGFEERL